MESFAHKAAKDLFTQWLREAGEKAGYGNWAEFCDMHFRANRHGPNYGIWTEYPIVPASRIENKMPEGWYIGAHWAWDECSLEEQQFFAPPPPNHFVLLPPSQAPATYVNNNSSWIEKAPTFEELHNRKWYPKAIADIAVQHKGRLVYYIEIVHKHAISFQKLQFLRNLSSCRGILEIPTQWILGQVNVPTTIPPKFWKFKNNRNMFRPGCELMGWDDIQTLPRDLKLLNSEKTTGDLLNMLQAM